MKSLTIALCLVIVATAGAAQTASSPAEQDLFEAAHDGQLAEVKRLVAEGVDVDGDTALSFARQNGHEDVAALLERPPEAPNNDG